MTSHGASEKPLMPTLTYESYLNLEHVEFVSAQTLRKLIMMHGFKSFNIPKDDLMAAASSIELMDAHHSTLQSDVSSNAFLSLNDVTKDLSLLHWQECCITSIETINSVTDFGSGVEEESSPKPVKRLKTDCKSACSTKKIKHKLTSSSIVLGLPCLIKNQVHTAQSTAQKKNPQAQPTARQNIPQAQLTVQQKNSQAQTTTQLDDQNRPKRITRKSARFLE